MSHKHRVLMDKVVASSESDNWDEARREWDVVDRDFIEGASEVCQCTQTGLATVYTIHNRRTGRRLYPIGSVCINKFEVPEMTESMKELDRLDRMGEQVVAMGKFEGQRFKDVPDWYLEFIAENARRKAYAPLLEYYRARSAR